MDALSLRSSLFRGGGGWTGGLPRKIGLGLHVETANSRRSLCFLGSFKFLDREIVQRCYCYRKLNIGLNRICVDGGLMI